MHGPFIDDGGCMSARHMSLIVDLIFMVCWLKFTPNFSDLVSFVITMQPRITLFGPHIDDEWPDSIFIFYWLC
jgi:hypothetical protein